jgi:hypothetical protein
MFDGVLPTRTWRTSGTPRIRPCKAHRPASIRPLDIVLLCISFDFEPLILFPGSMSLPHSRTLYVAMVVGALFGQSAAGPQLRGPTRWSHTRGGSAGSLGGAWASNGFVRYDKGIDFGKSAAPRALDAATRPRPVGSLGGVWGSNGFVRYDKGLAISKSGTRQSFGTAMRSTMNDYNSQAGVPIPRHVLPPASLSSSVHPGSSFSGKNKKIPSPFGQNHRLTSSSPSRNRIHGSPTPFSSSVRSSHRIQGGGGAPGRSGDAATSGLHGILRSAGNPRKEIQGLRVRFAPGTKE